MHLWSVVVVVVLWTGAVSAAVLRLPVPAHWLAIGQEEVEAMRKANPAPAAGLPKAKARLQTGESLWKVIRSMRGVFRHWNPPILNKNPFSH